LALLVTDGHIASVAGERTRADQILDAAASEFCRVGYSASTMRSVAERAGLLKGSIYHYYSSKEEILFRITWEVHLVLQQQVEAILEDTLEPLARVRAILRNHAKYSLENLEYTSVFYNEFRSLESSHLRTIVRVRDEYEQIIRDQLDEGVLQGKLPASLDTKLATLAVLGLLNSLHRWYQRGGLYGPDDVADFFSEFAVRGLQGLGTGFGDASEVEGAR
jgi:TetR/AcrR family transcriptional regulator, cholesterol catabolism regulator